MILLDIVLSGGWLLVTLIALAIIFYSIYDANKTKNKTLEKVRELEAKLKESENIMKMNSAELKVTYQKWAIDELEKYKKTEIENVQKCAEKNALEAASVLLQRWKIENEAKIRQDAINRSYSVNLGKITEHLIPFHQSFLSQFNPKDARFIGSPIDLIVFDGYADKKDEIQIYLVEIKTGNSKLTEIQKKIKQSVLNGNIRWAEINPADINETLILNSNLQTNKTSQLLLDFNIEKDLQKLLLTVEPKNGETRDSLIDRIADAIEAIGTHVDNDNYTMTNAIQKTINDSELKFKTESDKQTFIYSVTKSFETI